ncbi:MAG: pimeloyl-ACP methyl ester carboxylesterase [Mariniblastus sp.]|jgi:pimeloyl-ACP methyl ester carboxylesterase
MQGELVFTTTSDHVRLHGFYLHSTAQLATSPVVGSVDAAVLVHGLGGNFYSSRMLLHFAKTLTDLGISVVVVNSRGHDMINTSTWAGRSRSLGAAMENVADATFDLTAWADFLVERGHRNVLMVGHSLGAIKTLYAQANAAHPKVRATICLSAARLSYAKLIASERGSLFRETYARCEAMVANSRGDEPIHVQFPYPTWMTSACYIDKYGPDEKFNWLTFVDKIEVPTLLVFGQKELDQDLAFDGLRPQLETLKNGWNALDIEEIEDADHFYTAKFAAVDEQLVRWLTR